MTNNSIYLFNQLQASMFSSEIEKFKNRDEPLSIVGIKFKESNELLNNYSKVLRFVYEFVSASNAFIHNNGVFLFTMPHTKLHTATIQVKHLIINLKMSFPFAEVEGIGISALEAEDSNSSFLERINSFIENSIKSDSTIYYGTSRFSYSDSKETLKSLFTKSPEIYGYGFYKEAPLMQKGEVIEYSDTVFKVKFHKEFLEFLKKEEYIYLEHHDLPDIIKCDIIEVDLQNTFVELSDVKFVDDSPVHRKNIRVTPHKPIKAHISCGVDYEAEGIIYDISKESLLITMQLPKVVELNAKELTNSKFEISFGMEIETDNTTMVSTKAMIFKIIGNQIVFTIYPTKDAENEILAYIQKCQQILLLEAKGVRL